MTSFWNVYGQQANQRGTRATGTTGYRVINGENDRFPGLVLDRYEETLVIKLYTSSWFPFLNELCELFQKEFNSQQVVLRLAQNISKSQDPNAAHYDGQVLLAIRVRVG